MKKFNFIYLAFFTLLTISSPTAAQEFSYEPFAVVELFTSEGCSSCPPADKFFSELTKAASKDNKKVYTLGFHVDYWNNLGWPDRFSQADFTHRQHNYGRVHRLNTIYTPHMIINGREGFSGQRADLAQKYIDAALLKPAEVAIYLTARKEKDRVTVYYQLSSVPPESQLHIALVEGGLVSEVKAGENAGKTLPHDNVVRAFVSLPINDPPYGNTDLPLPGTIDPAQSAVIAFVQKTNDLTILGAARLEFPR